MFLQHENYFINKDKIRYFHIDVDNLKVTVNFSKDEFYIAEFKDRRDLDYFIAQLRKQ